MAIKFRWVEKHEMFRTYRYYMGRSKNAKIEVTKGASGKYVFFVERDKDDFVFNSAWGNHPNEVYQKLLNELPDMRFVKDADALEFVDNWVHMNVPKLEKTSK